MNSKQWSAIQKTNGEYERNNPLPVPFNVPNSVVVGTVYRFPFMANFTTYEDVSITLDKQGIHGTCVIEGVSYELVRINSKLDQILGSYAFDIEE